MAEHVCTNPVCKQTETGGCAEGFEDLDECPFCTRPNAASSSGELRESVKAGEEEEKKDDGEEEERDAEYEVDREDGVADFQAESLAPQFNYRAVGNGTGLDVVGANQIAAAHPTKLVALIGPNDCGKTTLSVTLYEALQQGSFAGWNFAGSRTLVGFEQRCHLARIESRGAEPDTPRTAFGDGLQFLHLGLWGEGRERVDLLLADRAGEFYTRAANDAEECTGLLEVERSDALCFLADGERLVDLAERQKIRSHMMQIIDALVESGLLTPEKQRISLVLTKYDKVKGNATAEDFFRRLVVDVRRIHGPYFEAFSVAARPKDDAFDPRYGVEGLLVWWLEDRPVIPFEPERTDVEARRKFHSFAVRGYDV